MEKFKEWRDILRSGNLTAIANLQALNLTSLEQELGNTSLDIVTPDIQSILVAIYSITAVLSVAGNVTVIVVLSLGKRSSGDLRAFLINLAVSDVTMAVFSIPFSYTMFMLGRWIFHPMFCPVVIVMQHVSAIVSVYTLTAIGIDRYNAIMHPFERRLTKLRTKLIICGIWLTAVSMSAIQFHVSSAQPFKYGNKDYYKCEERWEPPLNGQAFTIVIFVLTFALPLLALSFTYISIARRLWGTAPPGNADMNRDQTQMRAKKKVIKMMVIIVLLFATCWLPLQTFSMLYYFIPKFHYFFTRQRKQLFAAFYFTCLWLANANSLVNPLVYCFMSDTFMADLKDLFRSRRLGHYSRRTSKTNPTESARSGSSRTSTQICLLQRGATIVNGGCTRCDSTTTDRFVYREPSVTSPSENSKQSRPNASQM